MAGRVQAVRDHDDGLPVRVALIQHAEQLRGRARIERAGRLVCQQQCGHGDQRAGGSGPLPLAARYLIGIFFEQRRDTQPAGQRQQAVFHLLARPSGQHKREQDVLTQRQRVEQVAVLKDKTQPVAAERGQRAVGDCGEVLALEQDAAVGRPVERCEQGEQRGLAAAALAHDRDEFTLCHPKTYPAQRGYAARTEAGAVFLCQTLDGQQHNNASLH